MKLDIPHFPRAEPLELGDIHDATAKLSDPQERKVTRELLWGLAINTGAKTSPPDRDRQLRARVVVLGCLTPTTRRLRGRLPSWKRDAAGRFVRS